MLGHIAKKGITTLTNAIAL